MDLWGWLRVVVNNLLCPCSYALDCLNVTGAVFQTSSNRTFIGHPGSCAPISQTFLGDECKTSVACFTSISSPASFGCVTDVQCNLNRMVILGDLADGVTGAIAYLKMQRIRY